MASLTKNCEDRECGRSNYPLWREAMRTIVAPYLSAATFAAAAFAEDAPKKGNDFDEGRNDFHRNVSNTRNLNAAASRYVNVNANRNVHVSGGGCCYGDYNTDPSWGGVAVLS